MAYSLPSAAVTRPSKEASLGTVSVVITAQAALWAASALWASAARAAGTPSSNGAKSSSAPMTPVEATSTSEGSQPSSAAT